PGRRNDLSLPHVEFRESCRGRGSGSSFLEQNQNVEPGARSPKPGQRTIMSQIVPDAVERYLAALNHASDAVLDDVAREGERQDLPLVDAEVGALLRVLALSIGAQRILEIGTAIGYSGIWLAGALPPGGMLFTMEKDPDRARTARANFERAGLADRVGILVGDAQVTIAKVAGPRGLIFFGETRARCR